MISKTFDLPRSGTNRLVLPCIDCLTPLGEPPWSCKADEDWTLDDVAECATCGLRYAGDLLRTADAEAWAYVALNRLFCRECGWGEKSYVAVVHTSEGQVVACPTHGPAPARAFGTDKGEE